MIDVASLHFPAGVAIGLGSAAPIGPINLLVMQRTLLRGARSGLTLGVCGAFGDAIFAVIAAFGIAAVSRILTEHIHAIRIFGGLVMLAFAVVLWRARPQRRDDPAPTSTPRMAAAIIGLTLTNPATFLFFLGSFGAIGFSGIGHDTDAHLVNSALVVAGVFSGSMLWWFAVVGATRLLRERVTDRHLIIFNRVTAVVLMLSGSAAVLTGVLKP
ncbi:LysE family translocator [Glacieibacterium sp.]|uniref:LysE family translocator n=1 Tax=Glacieibacterium sp. TaxID=2860237 RepID=UPI003AFFA557